MSEYQDAARKVGMVFKGPFLGIRTKSPHQCVKCKAVSNLFPDNVLRGKSRCTQCDSTRRWLTEDTYRKLLKPLGIELIGPFGRTQKSVSDYRCSACGYTWQSTVNRIIHNKSGCPACMKDHANTGWKRRKEVKIGSRTVLVQGYEPQALEFLKQAGCNLNKLSFHTEEGKPTFNFVFKGTRRLYIPDFFHLGKNRVIEVKSVWTFAGTKEMFSINKAKRKAVVGSGYAFHLLLMSEHGDRIVLPKSWYRLSYSEVRKFLKR